MAEHTSLHILCGLLSSYCLGSECLLPLLLSLIKLYKSISIFIKSQIQPVNSVSGWNNILGGDLCRRSKHVRLNLRWLLKLEGNQEVNFQFNAVEKDIRAIKVICSSSKSVVWTNFIVLVVVL